MVRAYIKKFLNEKVYTLAKLRLGKKAQDVRQSQVDDILENFDENELTFTNLDEARDFLAKNKKSTVVRQRPMDQTRSLTLEASTYSAKAPAKRVKKMTRKPVSKAEKEGTSPLLFLLGAVLLGTVFYYWKLKK